MDPDLSAAEATEIGQAWIRPTRMPKVKAKETKLAPTATPESGR